MVMAWTQAKAIALIVVAVFLCGVTTYVAVRNTTESRPTTPEIGGFGFALRRDGQARASFAKIRPDSAAARAGLANGLVLRSIDGVPVADMGLRECIGRMYGPAGSVLRLEASDPQRDVTNLVELTRRAAPANIGGIGVALDWDKKTRAPSVVVVVPGSAAERAGFSKGLIIQAINGAPTAGLEIRECERRIQGRPGSLVRLELINLERNATNTVELTRVRL
jgi:C-terminal processing protease CtpA/Prc